MPGITSIRPQVLLILLWGMPFLACSPQQQQLDNALELESEARYSEAIWIYQKLYDKYPDMVAVWNGLGRIYSLHPLTVYAGLDFLRRSYEQKRDEKVWHDLLLLLTALGDYKQALQYLQEPKIRLEQLFEPDVIAWRYGLKCMADPGYNSFQELNKQPDDARRDFFILLCAEQYGQAAKYTPRALDTIAQELEQKTPQIYCEYLVMLANKNKTASADSGRQLHECRLKFPGQIAIQREVFPEPVLADYMKYTFQGLFQTNPYHSIDPGRTDIPPWPDLRFLTDEERRIFKSE